ncbi:MAG: signal peptidase I [Coriobacteriia bacterium]|nr:signal peptidase I [Coriobacteriia bacterium]
MPPEERSIPVEYEYGAEHRQEEPISFLRWLGELVLMVVLAFVLASGIRTFVVQPYVVPTGSMIPTIELQDRVIANKFVYRFREPEAGEIVVLDDPTGTVTTLIKRVVATGGQTVDLQDGSVVVDGVPLDESYTHGLPSEPMSLDMPYTVPEGSVWLMGDNRTNSADSRVFGAVPLSEIKGRAVFCFWPIDRLGVLE